MRAWDGATHQPGVATLRDDGRTSRTAGEDHGDHLLGRGGTDDREGVAVPATCPIGLVGGTQVGVSEDVARPDRGTERLEQLLVWAHGRTCCHATHRSGPPQRPAAAGPRLCRLPRRGSQPGVGHRPSNPLGRPCRGLRRSVRTVRRYPRHRRGSGARVGRVSPPAPRTGRPGRDRPSLANTGLASPLPGRRATGRRRGSPPRADGSRSHSSDPCRPRRQT